MKTCYLLVFLLVALPSWSMVKFKLPAETPPQYEEMQNRLYGSICKQAHYLLARTKQYPNHPDMRLLTKSIHGEHGIRPNTGTIFGLSFLYRFGEYDPNLVGVGKEALLKDYIIPMMNYVSATYDSMPTDDGKCWKAQWQSAHWAYSLGKAAWYIGDDLPPRLRDNICRIVKLEAMRFYDIEPPHRVKLDTASEENAWNSQIFHIASLLMPDDRDNAQWQDLFRKWVVSSYVTANDINRGMTVGGLKISDFKGANIYDDYTLENHGIVHPDYMCAFILSLQTAIDYKMTGREVPGFLLYNIPGIYDNLKWFSLPDGGLTYPSWQDWRLFRNPDWVINHLYMSVFAQDKDAMHYAREAFECLERMQERNPDGGIYAEQEYLFPSTQNDIMVYLAQAWQTLHYASDVVDDYRPKTGVRHFVNGKILLDKSEKFLHSLSYGNKIMFLPTINSRDRVFDSYQGSGIGSIRLKGDKQSLPVSLKDINIKTGSHSYHVEMIVMHGDAVEARYCIDARKDKLEVKEVLSAVRDCDIDRISTSEFGVLNNEFWIREKGYRSLVFDNQVHRCGSLTGMTVEIKAGEFKIDNVTFHVKHKDNPFTSRYTGTRKYNHARATDVLSLNYNDEDTFVAKGTILSELDYEIGVSLPYVK